MSFGICSFSLRNKARGATILEFGNRDRVQDGGGVSLEDEAGEQRNEIFNISLIGRMRFSYKAEGVVLVTILEYKSWRT